MTELSKILEAILFVSGEKSSNGLHLFGICQKNNPNSFMVAHPVQICDLHLKGYDTIGICGATSTPMWLMKQIKQVITSSIVP